MRVDNLQKEMNPVPSCFPVRGNPKAMTQTRARWTTTKCRVYKVASANTYVSVTAKDVYDALSVNAEFRVLGLKVWNATSPGASTNFLRVASSDALMTNDKDTKSCLVGDDTGTATSLAGVGMNVPDLLAANNTASNTATMALFSMRGDPVEPGTVATPQTYVVDVTVRWQPTF